MAIVMNQRQKRIALLSFSIASALVCLLQEFIALHYYDPHHNHGGYAVWSFLGLNHGTPRYLQLSVLEQEPTRGEEAHQAHQAHHQDLGDIHYSQTEILPLTDWEQQSLEGLRKAAELIMAQRIHSMMNSANTSTASSKQEISKVVDDSCQPPPGIPKQCCIGSFAGMGRIIPNMRHHCASSWQEQEQLLELLHDTTTTTTTTTAATCDICQLVDTLHHNNQTLAFWGDSMSHQTFQGLVCELYRRNYIVQESSIHFQNPSQRRRRKQQQQQQEQQQQSNNLDSFLTPTTSTGEAQHQTRQSPCMGINHCLHLVRTIKVSSPLWNSNSTQPFSVRIHFFHQYRIPSEDTRQEEWVLNAADILVLNFGLHWGANYGVINHDGGDGYSEAGNALNADLYKNQSLPQIADLHNHPPTPIHLQQALTNLLLKVASRKDPPRVLFRETSAQHFDSDGGDYSFVKAQQKANKKQRTNSATATTTNNYNNNNNNNNSNKADLSTISATSDRLERQPLQCVPHRDGPTSGWREQVVIKAAQQANYSVSIVGTRHTPDDGTSTAHKDFLTILPFFDFTRQLHQLHPYDDRSKEGGGGGEDCTHYCSSPYLYMPLWRSLRLALQMDDTVYS